MMKCHYEVLGIERNADDSTIRTSYRKLALRWHPDKNPDNLELAKEQFLAVQQAYEVLSDPQERAWYDNHREQILRGSHTNYEDNTLDVYQYFTATCYRGFGDDDQGFYTVYRQIFEKIATEDIEFMESEMEFDAIPKFGESTSDYDNVVGPFYAYWQSYCTKKSYAWLCPHDMSGIRDRRILREIEKETKKIGQKARKERNDEIRALVAFVRKRDKRVLERKRQLEEKVEQNRLKQREKRLEQIRRNKEAVEAMGRQCEGELYISERRHEEQLKMMEKAYASDDDDDELVYSKTTMNGITNGTEMIDLDNIDPADFVDSLYCIACNKAFKNESSFKNHETSKRHRENIEKLKSQMKNDDELRDSESSSDSEIEFNDADDVDEEVLVNGKELNGSETELPKAEDKVEKSDENDDVDPEVVEPLKNKKKGAKNKSKRKNPIAKNVNDDDDEDDDIPDLLKLNKPNKVNVAAAAAAAADDESDDDDDTDDDDDWNGKKSKKGKKAQRKNIKQKSSKPSMTKQPMAESVRNKKDRNHDADDMMEKTVDINLTCVTCKSVFPSKNKLFNHLKSTGHGVYIDKNNPKLMDAEMAPKKIKKKQFYSKVTL